MKTLQGNLNSKSYKFAVVVSRFNEFISGRLLEGTLKCFNKFNIPDENITIVKVPGAFEIPVAAELLAEQKKYNAIVCLGAVIRGGTPHFEYVAGSAANGIMNVSLKHKIPVIFGILTTDTYEQALERSDLNDEQTGDELTIEAKKESGSGNKGWDFALTAIEMADLFSKI